MKFTSLKGNKTRYDKILGNVEEGPTADLDDDKDEGEGEEDVSEAYKISDGLELPNYNDVEKRLAKPEMTATKQRNYLNYVIKNADTRRRQVIALKSNATKKIQ